MTTNANSTGDWVDVGFDMAAMAAKAINDALKERGHMNILIAGRTGVGKSTLINAMFNGEMAETGQGRPVTTGTREISKPGVPVSIWDTRGLEMEAFKETLAELERVIGARSRETDHNRHIHVAWVCIQEDGRRVEEAEIKLHEMLARHMPVIGVVTKARADNGFRAKVQELLAHARNVVRVRALREEFDDGHHMEILGLDKLVEVTGDALPDGHKRAFVAAQKASFEHKKHESQKIIAVASAAAGAAGAAPIPFADAALLVPIQTGMLAAISVTFGLETSEGFLSTLIGVAAGSTGATYLGRSTARWN